jgi:hypothetical protein
MEKHKRSSRFVILSVAKDLLLSARTRPNSEMTIRNTGMI